MARDCPDRQKGTSWRNDGPRNAGRLGGGDAVDREYEVSLSQIYLSSERGPNIEYSNLCKNSAAVPKAPQPASKPALVLTAMAIAMPNLGNVVPPVLPPHGGLETMTRIMKAVVAAAVAAVPLHGATATVPTMATGAEIVITAAAVVAAATAKTTTRHLLPRALLRGTNRVLHSSRVIPAILAIRDTVRHLEWALLPACLQLLVWEARHRVFPETSMH